MDTQPSTPNPSVTPVSSTPPPVQNSGWIKWVVGAVIALVVLFFVLPLILGLVGLSIFGGAIKKAVDEANSTTSSYIMNNNTTTNYSNNNTSSDDFDAALGIFGNPKLASDFPSDSPIFSPSKLFTSNKSTSNGSTTWGGVWLVNKNDADQDKIFNYYKSELVKRSWTLKDESQSGYGSTITARKGTTSFSMTEIDYTGNSKYVYVSTTYETNYYSDDSK